MPVISIGRVHVSKKPEYMYQLLRHSVVLFVNKVPFKEWRRRQNLLNQSYKLAKLHWNLQKVNFVQSVGKLTSTGTAQLDSRVSH